jgi:hypothetical protein
VLSCCPATSFMVLNALPLFLSSEYSPSSVLFWGFVVVH